jgi:hypothetical protein
MKDQILLDLDLDVINLLKTLEGDEKEAAIYCRSSLLGDDEIESSHMATGTLEGLSICINAMLMKEDGIRSAIFVGILNYLDTSEELNEESRVFMKCLKEIE